MVKKIDDTILRVSKGENSLPIIFSGAQGASPITVSFRENPLFFELLQIAKDRGFKLESKGSSVIAVTDPEGQPITSVQNHNKEQWMRDMHYTLYRAVGE